LDGFTLSSTTVDIVDDTYLDTSDRALFNAGYSFRYRSNDYGTLATLKQLAHSQNSVYKRTELEAYLPSGLQPLEWPAGPLRDLIIKHIDHKKLTRLFELHQKRIKRMVLANEVPIAELSLDKVQIRADSDELEFFELEIEVRGSGTEIELNTIIGQLKSRWSLHAEPFSKFDHGITLVNKLKIDGTHQK
jgi:exopolyphosphatase/guanosine-5'-triphosphate,3'-diphosphate pyrophosphatase